MLGLYWEAAGRHRLLYLWGTLALLAVDLLDVTPPLLVGLLIDQVQRDRPEYLPITIAAAFLGVILLQNVLRYPMRLYFRGTAARVCADLRDDYARHILRLPASFFTRQSTGDLMSRASNDLEAVERAMGFGLLMSIDTFYYLATIPVILLLTSPTLCLYAFALMPLVPLFAYFGSKLIHKRYEEVQSIFGEMSAQAQQNASGVQVVRSYGAERHEIGGFGKVADRFVDSNLALARIEAMFWPAMSLFLSAGTFAVLYFGGWKTLGGEISVGQFVMFMQYIQMLIWPLMALGWTIALLQRGKASLLRIREILRTAPAIQDGGRELPRASGEVEVRGLTFRYPGTEADVLRDVSFRVRPGETVAIVGPVGAGKSTLVDLMVRAYDPPPGTVFLDGVDVREFNLEDLRGQFAVVPQDTFLFSESIESNIRVGGEGDVKWAAEASRLSQDKFPEGYESILGEKGVNLSGGQKQRVALARAYVRRAPVLVLDDALSAVDAETEEAIMEHLRQVRRSCTCLIISHRLKTVREADRIVVLDEGRKVEEGTNEELMERGGLYAELARRQLWSEALAHE
jgi:ATP-binding cassette subfamily B protein